MCHDVSPGDEVLVPAAAVLPSLFPISVIGAKPVPVDVEPDSLGFDPHDLEGKISPRTKAALIVPLWGYPIDYAQTLAMLERHNIPLIEDAAHAHGARIGDHLVGTLGRAGCFSTHDRKLLSTGEGGFILTDDENLADHILSYSRLGHLSGDVYGTNFRSNALAAALGLARIKGLQGQIDKRTRNAQTILREIKGSRTFKELSVPPGGVPNYYSLVLSTTLAGQQRANLEGALDKVGVQSDRVKYGYDVFYKRKLYRGLSTYCPNAENLLASLIQIPVHPGMSEDHLSEIAALLKTFAR